MISPFDAWAVKRALVGHDLTDTLPGVSRMLRPVVEHLGTLPSAEARGIAWQALLCICPFREQLVRAVDEADPGGSPPEGDAGRRSAHLGDLAASAACRRFVWPSWIVRGEFNLLSADAKVGKTHLMLDLARRLWFQLPMPDGSEAPFPPRTCTLWVCGGRHQNDLRRGPRRSASPTRPCA